MPANAAGARTNTFLVHWAKPERAEDRGDHDALRCRRTRPAPERTRSWSTGPSRSERRTVAITMRSDAGERGRRQNEHVLGPLGQAGASGGPWRSRCAPMPANAAGARTNTFLVHWAKPERAEDRGDHDALRCRRTRPAPERTRSWSTGPSRSERRTVAITMRSDAGERGRRQNEHVLGPLGQAGASEESPRTSTNQPAAAMEGRQAPTPCRERESRTRGGSPRASGGRGVSDRRSAGRRRGNRRPA